MSVKGSGGVAARLFYRWTRRGVLFMGPNAKKRSRKQYVSYRLRILRDLCIAPPPQAMIDQMLDESKMSDAQVDAVFLGCIQRSR